ncbi:MAG: hypothetical protein LBV15_00885, partial [Planctomycetota bacterium]|nr:hypothetical protein [Planctomycetota bacterium]
MKAPFSPADFGRWRPLIHDLAGDIHPERWRGVGLSPAAADRLAACPRSRRLLSRRLDWLFPGASLDKPVIPDAGDE